MKPWWPIWHSLPPRGEVVIGRWSPDKRGHRMKRDEITGEWITQVGGKWDSCIRPDEWKNAAPHREPKR